MIDKPSEPMVAQSPVLAMTLKPFANAAAWAAVFELRVRLTADIHPETQKYAFADLSVAVKGLLEFFGDRMLEDERKHLSGCAPLRNKLFHLELSRVAGRVVNLGEEINRGGVWKVELATGDIHAVKDTSTQTGRIYGWLWESAKGGHFDAAARIFSGAIQMLDRLVALRLEEEMHDREVD